MKTIYRNALLALVIALVIPCHAFAATYTHDSLNRLKTVTYASGATITYTYDPGGNITQIVSRGPVVDADSDGIADGDDNCPALANADQADFDSDNIGDLCDPDLDGDGMNDVWETRFGLNPGDPLDGSDDPDGDGIPNAAEAAAGTDPARAGVLPPGYRLPSFITPLQLPPADGPLDGQRPLPLP